MRTYLAERAGVKSVREFFLLWALGADLPGAVTVAPSGGEPWPSDVSDDRATAAAAGVRMPCDFPWPAYN